MDPTVCLSHMRTFYGLLRNHNDGAQRSNIHLIKSIIKTEKPHFLVLCGHVSIANQRVTRLLGALTLVLTNVLKHVDRYWKQILS